MISLTAQKVAVVNSAQAFVLTFPGLCSFVEIAQTDSVILLCVSQTDGK